MQYVRSISGSVSKTWNSINPATLSGAIDVIVVEQEDGSLACSPFHIRFGKFSLLRPFEKKVEFRVNGDQQEFPMKLGEGGEAFFVFETNQSVPEALQTSPLVSPATSPDLRPDLLTTPSLQEPDPFELEGDTQSQSKDFPPPHLPPKKRVHARSTTEGVHIQPLGTTRSEGGPMSTLSISQDDPLLHRASSADPVTLAQRRLAPKLERTATDSDIPSARAAIEKSLDSSERLLPAERRPPSPLSRTDRSTTPPLSTKEDAVTRAINLSKKLWTSNIPTQVTASGDLMLDMTGYKSHTSEALQAEGIARKLLSEEIDGPYDIGGLIGADEHGNLWIYSSEEAKEAASRKATAHQLGALDAAYHSTDAISDPGYHSDDNRSESSSTNFAPNHLRRDSDSAVGMGSQPASPTSAVTAGDPNKNYAKTLRLTSDQLKTMNLKQGGNAMAFSVNRATCTATLWYWKYDVPIVISDIDGTITKSDVLGQVLNSIGRDWTHLGVAKLYTEMSANGYNFLYLTSRGVGQADTTRAYLDGVVQDGYKLPRGPVILSPDRTIAALRREIYLRKPEIFKMACLRDIMALFAGHGGAEDTHASAEAGLHANIPTSGGVGRGKGGSPFYAGFGNRLTDALSYRSVNIPSTRIFTINSNSEVSLDLLSLNKYKTGYASMREIVDHYFPPVGLRLLNEGGAEDFTDFNYWRQRPLDIGDFTDSEDEDDLPLPKAGGPHPALSVGTQESNLSEDEAGDELMDSYISEQRASADGSWHEDVEEEEELTSSTLEEEENEDGGALLEDEGENDDPITPQRDIENRLKQLDLEATPKAQGRADEAELR